MDKTELISAVAEKVGLSKKQVREVINEILSQIAKQLVLGQKVKLVGFGTFSKQYRAARDGRNPRTGERLIIPERHVVVFSPGSDLKQQVQEPMQQASQSQEDADNKQDDKKE
jgi:nucleoid DNA-binding protein|uniref:DNA-binding protein Hu homolog n=2 Tax=Cyanidioschyzon merolae TaxID=45157 RepID=Q7JFA2_CYAM1|nr:DNA-binding protein Hu homolog [Cyanidioschyzon merolae strain 10D]QFV17018.1 DNA-binding protein Hu-like protein [Cyanidioschyzon merolae]BAB86889.1 histone-like protein of chloroplast [Cyanidioschyzon merolae]BAC76229.1 DNA-binding protein Hu homolog [Cyanidioschyzon merolae strain 10D]